MLSNLMTVLRLGSLLLWFTACLPAWSNEAEMIESTPATGTSIKRKIVAGGTVPINQTYAQLAEEHRAYYRSFYNNMPVTDEPPFPKEGLISIFKPLTKVQGTLRSQGEVEMYVKVDASGQPLSVSVYKTPDLKTTEEIAKILMLIEYKPAICSGRPCVMEFPLIIQLRTF